MTDSAAEPLDALVRTSLADVAERVLPVDAPELARRLTEARQPDDGHRPRRRRPERRASRHWRSRPALVAAGVLVVAGLAGALLATRGTGPEGTDDVRTVAPPEPPPGFASLGPGWQPLDTGPVPAMSSGVGMVWTGTELIVAGEGSAHAYDPVASTWRSIGWPTAIGGSQLDLVWTGTEVVGVGQRDGGTGPDRAAERASITWDPDSGTWAEQGPVRGAPALKAALSAYGAGGPLTANHRVALMWTGERVLDMTHLAAYDPATGVWTPMPVPEDRDIIEFTHLQYTNPVWTGEEAVLLGWSSVPGLAWNRRGDAFREVPGVPDAFLGAEPSVLPDAVATAFDGDVVVVAQPGGGVTQGRAGRVEVDTGEWVPLPEVPGVEAWNGCPSGVVAVRSVLVVLPCVDGRPPVALGEEGWSPIGGGPPIGCCLGAWVVVDGALVVWQTDGDTLNNPDAPYVRAEVWVPPT